MIGWLKNRKEKKEKRRQDKHRRILNALKYKDTTGSSSDYGFYSVLYFSVDHQRKQ
jgi:hypothetical protein